MYLPENDAQMFDILSELRVYAAANQMPRLAENLDDALVLLALQSDRRSWDMAETGTSRDKA